MMNGNQQMKAIVQDTYGPPDSLSLREIDRPQPSDREVLLRVHAAGIDPGVWHLMTGLPYLVRLMGYGLRRPKAPIPGSDIAGVIDEVGKDVSEFRPGDEVFGTCSGAFAEFALATEDQLAPKPKSLAMNEAASIPTSGFAALQALRDAGGLQSGQSVLVVGATGGVGTFAVQIAKALGAEVTGVGSATKLDMVRSLGADHVVDYTKEDFTEGDTRYDLILDVAGNRPLSRLRRALAPTGTLVIVGGESGGRWFGGTNRQLGALLSSPFSRQTLRPLVSTPRKTDLTFLGELIETEKLWPVLDRTYPLAETPVALRRLAEGHSRGKTVIAILPSEHRSESLLDAKAHDGAWSFDRRQTRGSRVRSQPVQSGPRSSQGGRS